MSENESKPLPKPTIWDDLFPGRFLHAAHLREKDRTLTITDVSVEKLPREKGGEEIKGLLTFKETELVLGLNKTNGLCLKALFGARVADWIGKKLTIYPTTDRFGKDTVPCIRIRGSPDIAADLEITIKFPKKAAKVVTLTKTPPKGHPAATESASETKPAA